VIVKTEAVVLHARRFRESSRIVTLYTREYGKMSVVARGVVRPKSSYGPNLQPMGYLSVVIYRKEGRELQNLSTAEPLARFGVLTGSLERMTAGMAVVEIINAAMHDEDRNEALFEALVATLKMLNREDVDESSAYLWFLIRLSNLLGYAIRTNECGVCDEPVPTEGTIPYSLSLGAPLCAEHRNAAGGRSLSPEAFGLLRRLCAAAADDLAGMSPATAAGAELLDMLTAFIRYHVEGLKRLKVRSVSAKLLDGAPPPAT